jgi:hypothetical protein
MIFDFKQRTISAQFSNGEQLCFFEFPPHFKFLVLSRVSEDQAHAISRSTSIFGAGFLLQKTKSSPDRHRALHGCLIFGFFSSRRAFCFRKQTAPTQFSRQTGIGFALLGFPHLF